MGMSKTSRKAIIKKKLLINTIFNEKMYEESISIYED